MARIYVLVVMLAGGFAIAASMPHVADYDVRLFVVLAVLSLATSMAKVTLPLPRSGSTLTVCYVLDFTTLIVLGPHAATLTAALGAWSQCTLRRREAAPLFQALFSMGALALTVQASGLTYSLLGGQPGLPLATFHFEALIAASAVFFIVNSVLVAMAVALSTGQSTARVWTASYLWSWPGHLVGFGLAVGAAFGIGRSGLWLIPFSIVSLALTYRELQGVRHALHRLGHRSVDRLAQRPAPSVPGVAGACAIAARRLSDDADPRRPRRLQIDQRQLRPWLGRHGASSGRTVPAAVDSLCTTSAHGMGATSSSRCCPDAALTMHCSRPPGFRRRWPR